MTDETREDKLPLEALSIGGLFCSAEPNTFEVPIYQRNYAWGQREISTLVQDVYDAMRKDKNGKYYIGTLVTYPRDNDVLEVIDGQQRLTTIFIILKALEKLGAKVDGAEWANFNIRSKLTFRARRKSTKAIDELPNIENHSDKEEAILVGFEHAMKALEDIVVPSEEGAKPGDAFAEFSWFFRNRVTVILYKVPEDVDLNHYFEVMNSRGEQLEQHEIVKADLVSALDLQDRKSADNPGEDPGNSDRSKLAFVWDCCSNMGVYIQKSYGKAGKGAFSGDYRKFEAKSFDDLEVDEYSSEGFCTLEELTSSKSVDAPEDDDDDDPRDQFDPIIDFPNFLLVVLKLTCIQEGMPDCTSIILDDKDLKDQFDAVRGGLRRKAHGEIDFIKTFVLNLLKCRFYLDNYIVHRDNEKDNPWELERYEEGEGKSKASSRNLFEGGAQGKCRQLLSMFEVTYSAHQRKNYLLYCLLYLTNKRENKSEISGTAYSGFLARLAKAYLYKIYFGPQDHINGRNNAPTPGVFDEVILGKDGGLYRDEADGWPHVDSSCRPSFEEVQKRLGDGSQKSNGVPLFIFNYLDYLLWSEYNDSASGEGKETERDAFYEQVVCKKVGNRRLDFNVFKDFYFSTTRSSLEHFYSRAQQAEPDNDVEEAMIERFGNYAMISPQANSAASDWKPETKCEEYERYGKKDTVSINSLKFRIMLALCAEKKEWGADQIQAHQEAMVNVLLGKAFA